MERKIHIILGMGFAFAFMIMLPLIGLCEQIGEMEAIEKAKDTLKAQSGNPPIFMRVIRREDLENEYFLCQAMSKEGYAKYIYIFEIHENGIEITAPNKYQMHLGTDYWLLAVARQTGKVYPLYGFENARETFNRMAIDAKIGLLDKATASIYQDFYSYCVNGSDGGAIYNRADLKHGIDYFLCEYSETNEVCDPKYEKWWKGFVSSKIDLNRMERIVEKGSDYIISSIVLRQGDSKVPILMKITYILSAKGIVGLSNKTILYPSALHH